MICGNVYIHSRISFHVVDISKWKFALFYHIYFYSCIFKLYVNPACISCLAITTCFLFIEVWIFLFLFSVLFLSFFHFCVQGFCFLYSVMILYIYIFSLLSFLILLSLISTNCFFKCPVFLFMFAGVKYFFLSFLSPARTIVFAFKFAKRN